MAAQPIRKRVSAERRNYQPVAQAPVRTIATPSDKSAARKAVLVSVAVLVFFAIYRGGKNQDGFGTFRRIWATGVVGIFLAFLADFAPQVAGPFAVLVVLGSFTSGGDQALQSLVGKAGKPMANNPSSPGAEALATK